MFPVHSVLKTQNVFLGQNY